MYFINLFKLITITHYPSRSRVLTNNNQDWIINFPLVEVKMPRTDTQTRQTYYSYLFTSGHRNEKNPSKIHHYLNALDRRNSEKI